jgi:hypothetical protein
LFRTKGYVPTCYSPVCHSPCGAFDLHVLGLPPAFVLSQDQTLKLNENLNRLVTISSARRINDTLYDESQAHLSSSELEKHDELDKRDRQSLISQIFLRILGARTSPSTFLFLPIQLSNSKTTTGIRRYPPNAKTTETLSIPTKWVGDKNPKSSGDASASAAQWRRRRRWPLYRSSPLDLSTRVLKKLHKRGPLSENTTVHSPVRGGAGPSSKPGVLWISFVARGPFSRAIPRKISQTRGLACQIEASAQPFESRKQKNCG